MDQSPYANRRNHILNRHKRGRPRLTMWQKLTRRVLPPALVALLLGGLAYGLHWWGLF